MSSHTFISIAGLILLALAVHGSAANAGPVIYACPPTQPYDIEKYPGWRSVMPSITIDGVTRPTIIVTGVTVNDVGLFNDDPGKADRFSSVLVPENAEPGRTTSRGEAFLYLFPDNAKVWMECRYVDAKGKYSPYAPLVRELPSGLLSCSHAYNNPKIKSQILCDDGR